VKVHAKIFAGSLRRRRRPKYGVGVRFQVERVIYSFNIPSGSAARICFYHSLILVLYILCHTGAGNICLSLVLKNIQPPPPPCLIFRELTRNDVPSEQENPTLFL